MLEIRRSNSVSIYFFSNMRYTFVLQQCNSFANQAALRRCFMSSCFIAWPICISKFFSIKKASIVRFSLTNVVGSGKPRYFISTIQFTPCVNLSLLIPVSKIYQISQRENNSVKLRKLLCYKYLCHIICFCFVKIEIKCEFGRKKRKNWMTRRVV